MRRRIRRRQPQPICLGMNQSLRSQEGDKIVPDKELTEGGRTLDNGETDGLNIKLEKNSRDAHVVTNFPFIVGHTVLVRV